MPNANSEGTYQSTHLRCLIKAFFVHRYIVLSVKIQFNWGPNQPVHLNRLYIQGDLGLSCWHFGIRTLFSRVTLIFKHLSFLGPALPLCW